MINSWFEDGISLHICDTGDDSFADGSTKFPYKTFYRAITSLAGNMPNDVELKIKDDDGNWKLTTAQQYISAVNSFKTEIEVARAKDPFPGIDVDIEENMNLPKSEVIQIRETKNHVEKRVKIFGWSHKVRRETPTRMYIILTDGTGMLICQLNDDLCRTHDGHRVHNDSTVAVTGTLRLDKEHRITLSEEFLEVDFWHVIDLCKLRKLEADCSYKEFTYLQDYYRHLYIRELKVSKGFKLLSMLFSSLRAQFRDKGYTEVFPPTIVDLPEDGDGEPCDVAYFSGYLLMIQSARMYLESCLPVVGDCFSVVHSHHSYDGLRCQVWKMFEYTNVEVQFAFIDFEELLQHMEKDICAICDRLLKLAPDIVADLRKPYVPLKRPFERMTYDDFINMVGPSMHLRYGEDIKYNHITMQYFVKPLIVTHFLYGRKDFYTQPDPTRPSVIMAATLYLPEYGAIANASMTTTDIDLLNKTYSDFSINPQDFTWYTQLREFGACPNGGYSIHIERLLWSFINVRQICDLSLIPRTVGSFR